MNMIKETTYGYDNSLPACIEIKTTFDNKEEAAKVAETLLDKKLIACGQISEIESHYIWDSNREITKEFILVMKTRESLFNIVEKTIKENHSYDCPEIIATAIIKLSRDYHEWIIKNTKI